MFTFHLTIYLYLSVPSWTLLVSVSIFLHLVPYVWQCLRAWASPSPCCVRTTIGNFGSRDRARGLARIASSSYSTAFWSSLGTFWRFLKHTGDQSRSIPLLHSLIQHQWFVFHWSSGSNSDNMLAHCCRRFFADNLKLVGRANALLFFRWWATLYGLKSTLMTSNTRTDSCSAPSKQYTYCKPSNQNIYWMTSTSFIAWLCTFCRPSFEIKWSSSPWKYWINFTYNIFSGPHFTKHMSEGATNFACPTMIKTVNNHFYKCTTSLHFKLISDPAASSTDASFVFALDIGMSCFVPDSVVSNWLP